ADGPARFLLGFTCPALLRILLLLTLLTFTGLSASTVGLSKPFYFVKHSMSQSYNPDFAVTKSVWAIPRSVATTSGMAIVSSSSAYLDVSVQQVRSSYDVLYLQYSGLPHSDIYGSKCVCHYP